MPTDKNLRNSQVRLWCCIPLLFRYINNQIWRAANKNRINIISILINLQATGLEKPRETEQREISMCNVSPPAVCPLAAHSVLPAPLQQNTHSRETSLHFKTSYRPAQALKLRGCITVFFFKSRINNPIFKIL